MEVSVARKDSARTEGLRRAADLPIVMCAFP
jgi:hypothetical protein